MQVFKKCNCCTYSWFTRDHFLQDDRIELLGYQVNFGDLELGYLLFNHLDCKSTLGIHAGLFRDLYEGPVFSERLTGSESCRGYCLDKRMLQPCDARCECAYIREIIQIVLNWPKETRRLQGVVREHGR